MISHLQLRLLLLAIPTYNVLAATDCFTQAGDTYNKPANSTHRISAGVDCTDSKNNATCPIEAFGYVAESATINVTTASTLKIYDAIRQSTGKPFNSTIIGTVSNSTSDISHGEVGYEGFTANLKCFAGTLGDCIGDDFEDGTAVEACTPIALDSVDGDGFHVIDGTEAFVESDDASDMKTNPAATRPERSAALRMTFGSGPLGIVALGTVLWHLF